MSSDLMETLEIVRASIGDLKRGFGRSVDPARWVEQMQAFIDDALASAIPSRRADDAEGGSAGTEGSAVPEGQTPK